MHVEIHTVSPCVGDTLSCEWESVDLFRRCFGVVFLGAAVLTGSYICIYIYIYIKHGTYII